MKEKKKIDKSKIFTKIMAGLMAILMLFGICMTFIYYLIKS